MLGARFFEVLDYIACTVRQCSNPFGGIQVIFSGDFLQLPPVGDKFVFTSPRWAALNLTSDFISNSVSSKIRYILL